MPEWIKVKYYVDGREELAQVHPDDYNRIVSAAVTQGVSVGAYIGGAGGIAGALELAKLDSQRD